MPATEVLPPRPRLSLSTTEPTGFGSGFLSGMLSAILGIVGLGAVLTLMFPGVLAATELRPLYDLAYVRPLIHLALIASLLLGTVSFYLRANKTLAVTGLGCTVLAAVLGGRRCRSAIRPEMVPGSASISSCSTWCCIARYSSHSNASSRSGRPAGVPKRVARGSDVLLPQCRF